MRIDFSEPECSTCFHYRTSGILNAQETEPSNVIGSSVPVSSRPVQAATGSTSTSSPVHRFGTTTPTAPAAVSGPANSDSGAFGAPTPSRFGSTQASAFGFGAFGAPTPSTFGSRQAPAFGYRAFGAATPSIFGSVQAPVQASSASTTNTSSTSSPFNSSSPFGSASAVSPFGNGVAVGATPASFSSPFGPAQDLPKTTSASLFGKGVAFGATPVCVSSLFGPAPDLGKTASASPFANGVAFARPDVGILPPTSNQSTSTIYFGTTPVSVSSVSASSTPKNPFSSVFPGFGVGYLPGASSSNVFGANPSTFTPVCGGGSVSAALKTSSPQPFGFNAATTTLFPSCCPSLSATVSGIPNFGTSLFASREWSRPTEEGSRHPGYAPTPDFGTPNIGSNAHLMISISASDSYLHKSHEELRWEDYKQGDKGGLFPAAHISPIGSRPNAVFSPSTVSPSSDSYLHKSHEELRWEDYKQGGKVGLFPAAHISPIGSRPNAVFSPSTVSPSIFASRSIFDHPQRTTQGNMNGSAFGSFPADATTSSSSGFTLFPSSSSTSSTTIPAAPVSSSVQRPHETPAVSSSAFGCTACGATSIPSASGYSTFIGHTTPPSAATSLPGSLFSTSGSCPMMFGTTTLAAQGMAPALQAYPMMFGTTLVAQGTNLPVQGTTPAIQAYPVQGFILLPFAAMNLQ